MKGQKGNARQMEQKTKSGAKWIFGPHYVVGKGTLLRKGGSKHRNAEVEASIDTEG